MTISTEPEPMQSGPDPSSSPDALPESRPSSPAAALPMLDSLTGLRGLAAILVFCFHFTTFQFAFRPGGGLDFAPLHRPAFLTMSGNFAVGSFFILSGFVLTLTTRPGTSLANFYAKRVGKLYPVYLVTTVAAIVAILLIGMPISRGNVLLHLTLLQSWVPLQEYYHGVNPVTWSLSTEAFFYLLFPLTFFLIRRLSSRSLYGLLVATVFLEFSLPLYVARYFAISPAVPHLTYMSTAHNGGEVAYWFTLPFPPFRFLEFLSGMICCLLMSRRAVPTVRLGAAWGLCAVAYGIGTFVSGPLQRTAVGLIPLSVLVIALAQADFAGRRSLLRSRFLVWLGKLSYGMYAIQLLVFLPTTPFVVRWLSGTFDVPESEMSGPLWRIPLMIAYFSLIIMLAMPIYRYIEVPAYDYAKRRYRSRPGSEMFAGAEPVGGVVRSGPAR